jgi:hypothetical protein
MPNEALAFNTLKMAARTAAAQGHKHEAEAIFRRLAALIERRLGNDNFEYAACMHELADVCCELGSWAVAEQSYREALVIYRHCLPDSDPAIALALRSLADTCRHQGNQLEARRLEHEAATVLSKKLRGLR